MSFIFEQRLSRPIVNKRPVLILSNITMCFEGAYASCKFMFYCLKNASQVSNRTVKWQMKPVTESEKGR